VPPNCAHPHGLDERRPSNADDSTPTEPSITWPDHRGHAGEAREAAAATFDPLPLTQGVRSRCVPNGNGLTRHILQAGANRSRPLSCSCTDSRTRHPWRKIIVPLAEAALHVVAPTDAAADAPQAPTPSTTATQAPFRMFKLVRDQLALTSALGHA
jgi:hypothetical protein